MDASLCVRASNSYIFTGLLVNIGRLAKPVNNIPLCRNHLDPQLAFSTELRVSREKS